MVQIAPAIEDYLINTFLFGFSSHNLPYFRTLLYSAKGNGPATLYSASKIRTMSDLLRRQSVGLQYASGTDGPPSEDDPTYQRQFYEDDAGAAEFGRDFYSGVSYPS